ncbi:MAG: threonine--tRNA ligase [Candidatus Dependentiae bacterium]|nr:threonine--tRNA ligase [Candidatus Dependentiae bacterium]
MKNNNAALKTLRHSTAHLLAQAIVELYPKTQLTIGPATDEGFFYDFLPEHTFKEEDLPIIEARMLELANQNMPITHEQISKEEARKIYSHNPFKLELIEGIPGDTVGFAKQGDFYDLCKGDHVASTGLLKNFKLLGTSGSYWRADRSKQALQRISGTAFATAQELADYQKHREEAAKYDHRKLGKQMDLFSFQEEGVGFPFFHPKGKIIINALIKYLKGLLDEAEYQEISTPIMLSDELWRRSGHYAHYKDNMYFCNIDEKSYAIRPMNCPGSILVYKDRPHSYRELPLRLSEFGLVHRHELSGVLHGMLRVRSFTQDDAHIYCTVEQIEQEVLNIIDMTYKIYKKFGFNKINIGVSTRPANAMGSEDLWNTAIQALKSALERAGLTYEIYEGEGAFYGPKIEFGIEDSMGRTWQCGTIQIDFFQPENFDLTYVASSGNKERPVMIHRAIYGSMERFFAILLEHYKGLLPFWLAPLQVKVLTITDDQKEYAKTILASLKKQGIRTELDTSSDPLSGQIKVAQLDKVPWMLVIGKKEVEQNTVTLRYFDGKQEFGVSLEALLEKAAAANS